MTIQEMADYLYEQMTRLDAPISMGACLVMARHIEAVDNNILITKVVAKALEWAAHYPEASDGRNTFVLFAEWAEGLR